VLYVTSEVSQNTFAYVRVIWEMNSYVILSVMMAGKCQSMTLLLHLCATSKVSRDEGETMARDRDIARGDNYLSASSIWWWRWWRRWWWWWWWWMSPV